MRLAKFAGTFALFIAGMALLTFISLFVVGAYLASWPIMRVSPRARRLTSVMGLATAAMTVARAYGLDAVMARNANGPEPGVATEDPEVTEPSYPHFDGDDIVLASNVRASRDGEILAWDGRIYVLDTPDDREGGDI
jgi:hypothetical protein